MIPMNAMTKREKSLETRMQKQLKASMLFVVLSSLVSCIDAAPRPVPRDTTLKTPYQSVSNNWIGNPVSRIINEWGAPNRTFILAGKEYIVYVFESTITQGGSPGSRFQSGTGGYSYRETDCTYTFEIRQGIIVGGNVTGPNKNTEWCADGS